MLLSYRRHALIMLTRLFDLAAVCVIFLIALAISSNALTWPGFAEVFVMRVKIINLVLFMGYFFLCSAIFSLCGFYRSHRLSHWNQRLSEILFAVTFITAMLLVLSWILSFAFATNEFLLIFWFLTNCTLMLAREIARPLMYLARLRGRNLRNVVIVGEEPDVTALANRVKHEMSLGYRILRIIDAREPATNGRIIGDV
jgi:FlaA1/EpsC-like NDP-sugar epimerase